MNRRSFMKAMVVLPTLCLKLPALPVQDDPVINMSPRWDQSMLEFWENEWHEVAYRPPLIWRDGLEASIIRPVGE